MLLFQVSFHYRLRYTQASNLDLDLEKGFITYSCVNYYYIFNIIYMIQWTPLIRTTVNRNNRFIGPKWLGTDRPYINTLKIHRLMEPNPSLYRAILWPRSLLQRVARTSASDDNSVFCILLFTPILTMCPTLI